MIVKSAQDFLPYFLDLGKFKKFLAHNAQMTNCGNRRLLTFASKFLGRSREYRVFWLYFSRDELCFKSHSIYKNDAYLASGKTSKSSEIQDIIKYTS